MASSLLFLSIVLAVSCAIGCFACWYAVDNFDSSGKEHGNWFGLFAFLCGVAAVALAISAACVVSKHWNDNCHRHGGVLGSSSRQCLKPNSDIHID